MNIADYSLTLQENRIVPEVAKGLPRKVIADKIGISVRTLDFHLVNLRRKCGNFKSTPELSVFLARHVT